MANYANSVQINIRFCDSNTFLYLETRCSWKWCASQTYLQRSIDSSRRRIRKLLHRWLDDIASFRRKNKHKQTWQYPTDMTGIYVDFSWLFPIAKWPASAPDHLMANCSAWPPVANNEEEWSAREIEFSFACAALHRRQFRSLKYWSGCTYSSCVLQRCPNSITRPSSTSNWSQKPSELFWCNCSSLDNLPAKRGFHFFFRIFRLISCSHFIYILSFILKIHLILKENAIEWKWSLLFRRMKLERRLR